MNGKSNVVFADRCQSCPIQPTTGQKEADGAVCAPDHFVSKYHLPRSKKEFNTGDTVFLEGDVDAAKWGMSTENFPTHPHPEELEHECFREFCELNGIIRLSQLDWATREKVLDEIQFGQTTSKWVPLSDG